MRKYRFECWNVAFRRYENEIETNSAPLTVIRNPLLFWAADPFVVHKDHEYFIFAELYNRLTYKGDIRYCRLDENGRVVSKWKKALHTGGHLSFPNIWREGDDYYMMPEASKAEDLSVYKALRFPDRWKKHATLAERKKYADSIFLDREHILTYDNYSDPRRAVVLRKSDAQWTEVYAMDDPDIVFRPGGKAFMYQGRQIVPMQDSRSGEYGGSLRFCEIGRKGEAISVNDVFEIRPERLTAFKRPFRGRIMGVHTYNRDAELEVLDLKTYTSNLLSLIGYCFIKLSDFLRLRKGKGV